MTTPASPERLDLDAIKARNQDWLLLCNVSAESAVALIERLNATARDVPALIAEIERLRALTATCTCATTYATYEGPEPDCPVHGAVRAFNEAAAELDRVRPVLQAAEAWRDARNQTLDTILGRRCDALEGVYEEELEAGRALDTAVDSYRSGGVQ